MLPLFFYDHHDDLLLLLFQSVGPQMIGLSHMFDLRPSGYDSQVQNHYTEDEVRLTYIT